MPTPPLPLVAEDGSSPASLERLLLDLSGSAAADPAAALPAALDLAARAIRTLAERERRVAERTGELAAVNEALEEEVAEREAAREELLERTAELEGILQALPDQYMRVGPDLVVLDARLGEDASTSTSCVGRRVEDVAPPGLGPRFRAAFEEVLRTDRLASIEYQETNGPATQDFEGRIVPLEDGTMIWLGRDITGRKRAERALREREERFRRLIENASDLITVLDGAGIYHYHSPSIARVLGYDPEGKIGASAFDFVHPDDVEMARAAIEDMARNPGTTHTATVRFRHADGSWRVLESTGRTLLPDSAAQGIVVNSRDVTERQRAEEALRQASIDAERANRAKSEFLSRMSHELRTPMNSILGFAQLLGRADLAPQQGKSVQHILRAGRHLLNLINEVLEISRIEAGRQNFSLEPVRLGAVMQEAVGLVRPLAAQLGVEIEEGHGPLDEVFVRADRQRLVQVLLNLLSNAIKYNRPGGKVSLSRAHAGDAGRVAVQVRDSGPGIPEDRLDQLFTPFARLGAEQTDVEGTGLGLALSQRLSEAMGGALSLETTGPDGSVFLLELSPAADPVARLEDPVVLPATPEDGARSEAVILYIEDNLANLSLVETILLSRPGWRTVPALQGQLGVELAREYIPDLILLDLHLPDISGEEVLRRLRGDARTASIPVAIISADATRSSLERLRAAGADAYLTKPLDIDEFLTTLGEFLQPAEE